MTSVAFLQPAAAAPAALGARDARGVLRGWEAPGDGGRGTKVSSWMVGPCLGALTLRHLQRNRRSAAPRAPRAPRARGGEGVTLPEEALWIQRLDLEKFGSEVHDLGQKLKASQDQNDMKHLRKIVLWSRVCAVIGLGTMWMAPPNLVSIIFLSLWTHSAWTMMGHHACHGGYNRTDESGRFSSRGFALGSLWRRLQDWFDWMLPEAWSIEHNQLHHYRLSEDGDPDLLERNSQDWSPIERMIMPFVSMLVWKWAYYAPNTYKELKLQEMRTKKIPLPQNFDPQKPLTLGDLVAGEGQGVLSLTELMTKVMGPYFIFRFFLLPLPLIFFGPAFYFHGVCNLFLADILSNIHGFIVVVPNHAGNDLYRFERSCRPKSPTFYLRAITSSVNFDTGGDVNDFMHGWLNYQIEHHCWPDLSMLSYQKGQAQLKEICARHGVPYVQENVFIRLKKTLDIAMGKTKMRRYPDSMEREADMMVWQDQKVAA